MFSQRSCLTTDYPNQVWIILHIWVLCGLGLDNNAFTVVSLIQPRSLPLLACRLLACHVKIARVSPVRF